MNKYIYHLTDTSTEKEVIKLIKKRNETLEVVSGLLYWENHYSDDNPYKSQEVCFLDRADFITLLEHLYKNEDTYDDLIQKVFEYDYEASIREFYSEQ